MVKLIQAVCKNQNVLLEPADDLTGIIEDEEPVDNNPGILTELCKSLLSTGTELTNSAQATALMAGSSSTIAIKFIANLLTMK
ncbi:hypothetical protein [Leptolyngbya sp. GGD]|uniref:hypothetical protein n=1 Tax=Leptolyngbya sp. GGD TaxID=2997907 RepID=UPI00227C7FDF|nr:hypothetical protein [Leptolyngbya sp. GGD]MCY6493394.1 hypothetical protein [Leptolyngbya sp. GGD]